MYNLNALRGSNMKVSDCKCCKPKCKEMAVAFWPIVDLDIPSYPYCRKHLDEAKFKLLIKLQEYDKNIPTPPEVHSEGSNTDLADNS